MRAGRFRQGDSLDLLLDTMCNTFGGVIMIAILVALLARHSPAPLLPAQRAKSEMIERRLANAEAELAAARALRAQLDGGTSPAIADLASERDRLAEALRFAQATADAQAVETAQAAAMKSADPGRTLSRLAAQIAAQERRASDLENAMAAQDQNSERLHALLPQLAKQIENEFDTRTKKLRLPKERAKTKAPFNIIVKFDRAYPVTDAKGKPNVEALEWNDVPGGKSVRPIPGLGDDAAKLAALLQTLSRDEFYVIFYVYPDGFEAYGGAREIAVKAGLDYGLEILMPETGISFAEGGASPPPL